MMKRSKDCRRSDCPVSFTLDIVGDKWTLLLIRDIAFKGKKSYGQFLESEEKIATNILADRLKRLEESGIVRKKDDPKNQKKILYELTPKGIDLIPMLLEMVLWGAKHDPRTAAPKESIRRLKRDRAAVIAEFTNRARQV